MTDQLHPPNTTEPAPVPTHYPLLLAGVGLLLALGVAITQQTFTVVGWAGLAMIVLGLGAWALLAPDQARAALTGRTVRYGGTSLVVTVIFLIALVALYTLVKGLDLRWDLTQSDEFSLNEVSRDAITRLAADPTSPEINIVAFYGSALAARRDQDTLLFDDYANTSDGLIRYEFADPDRNPVLAQQYGITQAGQIAVVAVRDGEPDIENAELVSFFSQDQLTNAILNVAASGDFRAYFLSVEGGLDLDTEMLTLASNFRDSFGWTVEQVSFVDLLTPVSDLSLNDPTADGEVLVIAGGTKPLTEEELSVLTEYVANGGNLILYATLGLEEDGGSLANSANLSDYLWENFGLRFTDNIIIDQTQAVQTPLMPVATDFDFAHYINSTYANTGSGLIFEVPYSIEIAAEAPANVTVTALARSTADAYGKTDIDALIAGDIEPAEGDPSGPFVLAAAAENTQTGARLVLFGSTSIAIDSYALGMGIANLDAAFNSLVWTTHFNDYFAQVTVPYTERPQDTPISAGPTTLDTSTINFITSFIVPFGILGIGVLVWWLNRDRSLAQ